MKVENDECSNTDQYLSSLLENGESFLDHVKQEPIVVGDDEPDEAAVPSTSSLPSIHQRLGFMSQYIGMPQVVAGLHSGIIAPSRAYHWPEHGLTPTATISRLATQMVSSCVVIIFRIYTCVLDFLSVGNLSFYLPRKRIWQ